MQKEKLQAWLTKPAHKEPLPDRDATRCFDGKIYGYAEEWIRKAVIRGRFSGNNEPQIPWNVLQCVLSAYSTR
jgi:hypothetical protein